MIDIDLDILQRLGCHQAMPVTSSSSAIRLLGGVGVGIG
jgi:hypothetical protein